MSHDYHAWLHVHKPVNVARDVGAWGLPVLQFLVYWSAVVVAVIYLQRVVAIVLYGVAKVRGRAAHTIYKCSPLKLKDEDSRSSFPMVLVQIPMFNEKDVYHRSIGAVCRFSWPSDRLVVQVLDDSNDPEAKELIKKECEKWANKGINIKYETRPDRKGYKAGNLAAGLKHDYVRDCKFVAIFDADFEPRQDFLEVTIPYLVYNPELAFVMGAWGYANAEENWLARFQVLNFENYQQLSQPVGSELFGFATFFGTGGVWRLDALHDSGGWQHRALTEDTDLALTATIRGWKSLYVGIRSRGEVPVAYKTYRIQLTRWGSGVFSVFRIHALDILKSKALPLSTKYYILGIMFSFMVYENVAGCLFTCLVVPVTLLVPQVHVPTILLTSQFLAYGLHVVTLLPRVVHLASLWVLFENVRCVVRTKLLLSSVLGWSSTEWVVTKRVAAETGAKNIWAKLTEDRDIFYLELLVGVYLLLTAVFGSIAYWPLRVFLIPQSLIFFLCAFNVRF